jgi:aromatic ring-opening dioxygenase catalytic subunit (LigB family)
MSSSGNASQLQIVYFSHGGGPLPILGDASHQAMVAFMEQLPAQLHKPELIVVISAHWEEKAATLLGASHPPMLYDYYGFPPQAYEITYPAPGSPADARKIASLLAENQIAAEIDTQRGFDHGLFIPLNMMYPAADIPCLQLSLVRGLNPAAHVALGKALRALSQENVLVIGSGFSFHNMRAFTWRADKTCDPENDAFQDWLIETCTAPLSQAEQEQRLVGWTQAPFARYCHPREEHLLPLFVCQGLAGHPGKKIFDAPILGKRAVAFQW